jgi:MFS family permease
MLATLAGQTVFISLFGSSIRHDFAITAGQYGLLYMAATLCSAVLLVFAGPLTDRYSPRRVGLFSLIGLASACLLMSLSTSIPVLFLSLFGLRFFGQGMLSHNSATALTRWFGDFRGRALALSQFGYSTGEALLPLLVAFALLTMGWRQVWQSAAAILVLVFLPLILSLFRGNVPEITNAQPITGIVASAAQAAWTRGRVLRDSLFWWVLLGILANSAIVTLLFFHQANLIETKGWSPLVFAASFPVMSVTSVVAGMVGGVLLDRFGAWRLLPFILLPLCLANLVLWFARAEWAIAVFFFFAGISSGVVSGAASVVWAELYGTAHLGAIRALATAGLVFASAAGPGIAGVLIDAGIPVEKQCLAYAAYCALASIIYFMMQGRLRHRVLQLQPVTASS